MDTLAGGVVIVDWDKVFDEVKYEYLNGNVTIRDGVAYWAEDSGKTGIVQHLPFKAVPWDEKLNEISDLIKGNHAEQMEAINNLGNLIRSTHAAQMAAIGLSTTIIVGAIVVQTMYLAKKIDKLQEKMDQVSSDINTQNMMFYMEKLSKYFGTVESARVLLGDKSFVSETHDIAVNIISQLSIERNEVLFLINNLISIADQLSEQHLGNMLDFITMVLDIVPKGIYLESQLCDRYGKFKLSEHLMIENTKRYNITLEYYRNWCNSKATAAIRGKGVALTFHEKEDDLKAIFNSSQNKALLQPLLRPALVDDLAMAA